MLKRKYKEELNISEMPTFLPFISEIKYLDKPLFSIETTMDCKLTVQHIESKWEVKYQPQMHHFVVDDDDSFVNPWSIQQDFNRGMVRYLIRCNKITKCEIYVDPNKRIATVVYMSPIGDLVSKSFGLHEPV